MSAVSQNNQLEIILRAKEAYLGVAYSAALRHQNLPILIWVEEQSHSSETTKTLNVSFKKSSDVLNY